MPPIRHQMTFDPSVAFGKQKITTSFAIQFAWLPVLKTIAHQKQMSFSALVVEAIADYCEKHNVELPANQTWEVQKSA